MWALRRDTGEHGGCEDDVRVEAEGAGRPEEGSVFTLLCHE